MSNRWLDKYIVGLTGNIATGKSVILGMAAERGAFALDADQVVHQLLNGDQLVQEQIVKQFGNETLLPGGRIDRDAVAKIVFSNPVALSILEQIVHPAVRKEIFYQIERTDRPIIFIEAIKLLEGGLASECQELWVTRCSRDIQIDRLVTYRQMDREMAITRVDAQTPQLQKIALADVVIDTSGAMIETRAYFDLAWSGLRRRMMLDGVSGYAQDFRENETLLSTPIVPADAHPEEPEDVEIMSVLDQVQVAEVPAFPEISVRRAQSSDLDLLNDFINSTTGGDLQLTQHNLISDLHQRGYLIAQRAGQIEGVVGWSTENWVAKIDHIVIFPGDSSAELGRALLRKVVATAQEMICEAVMAFQDTDAPDEYQDLYLDLGFEYVDPQSLPSDWQKIVSELSPGSQFILIKLLRDTRQMNIRFLEREKVSRESP